MRLVLFNYISKLYKVVSLSESEDWRQASIKILNQKCNSEFKF